MKTALLSLSLIITIGIAAILLNKDDNLPPATSYYHWANSYQHNAELEKAYPPKRLYLKLLDIGWHQGRTRIHQTQIDQLPEVPVTPVIFLDQRVLKQETPQQLLATILDNIPPSEYSSLQVDCDWTGSTRDDYFELLTQLKKSYKDLSVTLRLHQVKYAGRTGTPPAHRGVLMYYNMSKVLDPNTKNYVLDNAIGKQYLQNFSNYSLPIDLALPLYQQTRVIRQGKLVKLVGSIDLNREKTALIDTQKTASLNNRYRVTKSHYWQEYYLYRDDELVLDTVTEEDLKQAAELLSPVMQPQEIIYYKWRDANRFKTETFDQIADYFN